MPVTEIESIFKIKKEGKMKDFIILNMVYEYLPTLEGGYYSATRGWHLYRSGRFVYNFDEKGVPFFNKVN